MDDAAGADDDAADADDDDKEDDEEEEGNTVGCKCVVLAKAEKREAEATAAGGGEAHTVSDGAHNKTSPARTVHAPRTQHTHITHT